MQAMAVPLEENDDRAGGGGGITLGKGPKASATAGVAAGILEDAALLLGTCHGLVELGGEPVGWHN